MRIVWLPEAATDLERLHGFLAEKDPAAAKQAVATVLAGADRLAHFPDIGRSMGDGTQRRELLLPFGGGSYVLRYRRHRDTAVILRVWHARETRG